MGRSLDRGGLPLPAAVSLNSRGGRRLSEALVAADRTSWLGRAVADFDFAA